MIKGTFPDSSLQMGSANMVLKCLWCWWKALKFRCKSYFVTCHFAGPHLITKGCHVCFSMKPITSCNEGCAFSWAHHQNPECFPACIDCIQIFFSTLSTVLFPMLDKEDTVSQPDNMWAYNIFSMICWFIATVALMSMHFLPGLVPVIVRSQVSCRAWWKWRSNTNTSVSSAMTRMLLLPEFARCTIC